MKDGNKREERCASCGSTANVIMHHLSYDPEIKVPLCLSCHRKVHFSRKPASVYRTVGRKSYDDFIEYSIHGKVVGWHFKGTVYCYSCLLDKGNATDLKSEDEFIAHLARNPEHIKWDRLPEVR